MSNRVKMKCGCVVVAGEDGVANYVIHCSEENQVREDCVFQEYYPGIKKGEYYPEMPPALPGENKDSGVYLDRITGDDDTGRVPYDHVRYRQCSMGRHEECSDPQGEGCKCPCHKIHEQVVKALDFCVGLIVAICKGQKWVTKPVMPWAEVKRVLAAAKAAL